jgi:hypothetical protein
MASDSELAAKVIKVIEENSVRKINFHLGGLNISSDGLQRVAYEIQKGNIKVIHDPNIKNDAEYDSKKDIISIKKKDFTDVEFKSLIIHEAVHAHIDIVKATKTRRLAAEAAAYLAQAIYLWHEVGDIRFRHNVQARLATPADRPLGQIYNACLTLIDLYKLASRSVWLEPILYQNLLNAIKGHGKYSHIRWDELSGADGTKAQSAQASKGKGSGFLSMGRSRKPGPIGMT